MICKTDRCGRASTLIAAMLTGLAVLGGMIVPVMAGGSDRPVSGVLAAANGPVAAGPMGTDDSAMRALAVGNKVFFEDEIVTGDGVRAQILLRDGTTFSIGEDARLVLDEFVFDPRTNAGGLGVVIKKGAFRFVSGKIARANPRNMRVLAGNTAIAVRGTEVIGTVGSDTESVILISGQVDLVSIGGDCVASGSGGDDGDMFGIGANGGLEFKADVVASAPDYCNRSLVRAGFGVQVAGGQIATPGRIDTDTIDAVIDAITIKETVEESSQQSEQSAPAEEEPADTAAAAEPGDAATAEAEPDSAVADAEADAEAAAEAAGGPAAPAAQDIVAVSTPEPIPDGEDGLSEFDKVVMRAFGLIDERDPAGSSADNTEAEPRGQLVLAANLAEEDLAEEDKSENAEDSGDETRDPDEAGLKDEVEDTPAEEEKRNETKVEDAVLDLNRPEGGTDSGGSSQTNTNTNSDPDPSNNAPTLASISGIAFVDSANDDSFTAVSATLDGSDSDSGDTLTYSISGGSADTSVSGFTHSRTGSYGTLYIDSGSGAYRYVPNDSAIEGLKTNASEDFTLSVSDGTASASQTLTASFTGADDTLTMATLAAVPLTDTAGDDSFSTVTGTVVATERDTADTATYAISGGSADTSVSGFTHSRAGTYGTLYINDSSGAYQFVPADNAIEQTTANVTEDFTVSVTAGGATVSETLTATVAGTNDTPIFNAISAISLTDTAATDSFTETTGTLSASERDNGQTVTFSASGQQVVSGDPDFTHGVQGSYGTLMFNENTGAYEFSPNDTLVNAAASAVSDSFTLTASDSALTTDRTLTVNIAGADDGPTAINTIALANVGGTQNTGVSANLRVGTTTDPEGDAITDISSALNTLPAWLTFGNQNLVNGTVEYFWVVGANEAPWRNGTATLQLQARSGSIDGARETISITFSCQTSYCNDYVQSANAVTSPAIDNPTDEDQIRTGIKIGTEDFLPLTAAERDALFNTGVSASGDFRVIFTTAETGSGSPTGSWTFDQQVNVDYQGQKLNVSGTVSANNISYFDGASDDFTYSTDIAYTDLVLGTTSVFGNSSTTSGNLTYELKEGGGQDVHIEITDQVGIVIDSNGVKAAVINTDVAPLAGNPPGHDDTGNKLIQKQWRLLEPQ